jgi:radical SAM superfamily enzyme YgiQ (UPF0313 family)
VTVRDDIVREVRMMQDPNYERVHAKLRDFAKKLGEKIPSIPNSLREFHDMTAWNNYRLANQVRPYSEYDEHMVPTEELERLASRLENVPTDNMLADIVGIIQRYEPESEPPMNNEYLTVDLTSFSVATVEKLKSYMDEHWNDAIDGEESETGES